MCIAALCQEVCLALHHMRSQPASQLGALQDLNITAHAQTDVATFGIDGTAAVPLLWFLVMPAKQPKGDFVQQADTESDVLA